MPDERRPALSVRALTAGYGERVVVEGVIFAAQEGEVLAVVGPNGSGKTTILKAISGTARQFEGQVLIGDKRVDGWPAWRRQRFGLLHIPQRGGVFQEMTVQENVQVAVGSHVSARRVAEVSREVARVFPSFPSLLDRRAGTLSGGERQAVAVARALAGGAKVALVDEPTQGLSEGLVSRVLSAFRSLARDHGMAVVLVEHRVHLALQHADRGLALRNGRLVADLPAQAMRNDAPFLSALFGMTSHGG